MIDPGVVAIVVALIAPVGAYLVAARRFSGKIESSDAAALWKESSDIRQWSAARIAELNKEVGVLRTRIEECVTTNSSLVDENRTLMNEVRSLNATVAELRSRIAELEEA